MVGGNGPLKSRTVFIFAPYSGVALGAQGTSFKKPSVDFNNKTPLVVRIGSPRGDTLICQRPLQVSTCLPANADPNPPPHPNSLPPSP